MSDDAVQARTGRVWADWFAELDAAGCRVKDHKGIVAILGERHPELPGWWQQSITIAYEKATGLRQTYERCDDTFASSASKTIGVPADTLSAAFTDDATRARWLPGATLTVRTTRPGKSVRALWGDGASRLEVNLYAKGPSKTQVAVQHDRLPTRETALQMKDYWAAALVRLKVLLEKDGAATAALVVFNHG